METCCYHGTVLTDARLMKTKKERKRARETKQNRAGQDRVQTLENEGVVKAGLSRLPKLDSLV